MTDSKYTICHRYGDKNYYLGGSYTIDKAALYTYEEVEKLYCEEMDKLLEDLHENPYNDYAIQALLTLEIKEVNL